MSHLRIDPAAARRIAQRTSRLGSAIVGWADRMAPSERLCVHLGHDAFAVCHVAGRFKPVVRDKVIVPTSAGVHDLTGRLAALGAWLDAHSVRARIDWILGIEYVRYLLLPWNTRLADDAFCRSVAAALFAQQCSGDKTPFADHQLRFGPLSFGQPRLAALIANDVIRELTAFSTQRRYRTHRIVPALSVAWNSLLTRVKNGTGVLALIDGPRLMRIASSDGRITAFSMQPFSETQRAAIPADATWVFPAHHPAASADRVFSIEGYEAGDDVRLAYALCGAI